MTKTPFVSKEILDTITEQFPTPFHLYDEKGIREKALLPDHGKQPLEAGITVGDVGERIGTHGGA